MDDSDSDGRWYLGGDGVGGIEQPGHVLCDLGLAFIHRHPGNLQGEELRQ